MYAVFTTLRAYAVGLGTVAVAVPVFVLGVVPVVRGLVSVYHHSDCPFTGDRNVFSLADCYCRRHQFWVQPLWPPFLRIKRRIRLRVSETL